MGKTGSDGNRLKHMNTLAGGDVSWLIGDEIRKNDILQYCYPSDREMEEANLRIVFLGYFWKDWSLLDNGIFSALRGLEVREESPDDIGDYVGVTSLDEDWVTFNQMIKYLKYGFGRITDYVNEDIRWKRMTREQGIALVEKYDGHCSPKYIESFCRYIGISVAQFWEIVDKGVNQNLFKKSGSGVWVPTFKVGQYEEEYCNH